MKKPKTVDINKEWAKKAGREKVISALKDAHPGVDIGAEFDKIVPPKEPKEK